MGLEGLAYSGCEKCRNRKGWYELMKDIKTRIADEVSRRWRGEGNAKGIAYDGVRRFAEQVCWRFFKEYRETWRSEANGASQVIVGTMTEVLKTVCRHVIGEMLEEGYIVEVRGKRKELGGENPVAEEEAEKVGLADRGVLLSDAINMLKELKGDKEVPASQRVGILQTLTKFAESADKPAVRITVEDYAEAFPDEMAAQARELDRLVLDACARLSGGKTQILSGSGPGAGDGAEEGGEEENAGDEGGEGGAGRRRTGFRRWDGS